MKMALKRGRSGGVVRRKFSIWLVVFFFLILINGDAGFAASNDCNNPPPPGPPPDNADDNFSFNIQGTEIAAAPGYCEYSPAVGVLRTGNFDNMKRLLKKLGRDPLFVEPDFNPDAVLKYVKVLIITTGGLMGLSQDQGFAFRLEHFVKNGGVAVVLCQQSSSHYSCLPGQFRAYGWRGLKRLSPRNYFVS